MRTGIAVVFHPWRILALRRCRLPVRVLSRFIVCFFPCACGAFIVPVFRLHVLRFCRLPVLPVAGRVSFPVAYGLQHGLAAVCHVEFVADGIGRPDAVAHVLSGKEDGLGGKDGSGAPGEDHRAVAWQLAECGLCEQRYVAQLLAFAGADGSAHGRHDRVLR